MKYALHSYAMASDISQGEKESCLLY